MGVDSKVRACNLALSFLNQGLELKDFDNDKTQAGMACRNFFDLTFEKMHRDYFWPRFNRRFALAKVADLEGREHRYAYRIPSDALFFRGFVFPRGTESMCLDAAEYRTHEIGGDEAGGLIFTDETAPIGQFAMYIPPQFWPADFTLCFALLLASYIAPTLTGGDQFKLGEQAFRRYQFDAPKAVAAGLNEQGVQVQRASGFERIRG